MAFSTNYSNLSNLMAPGEYEFVISDAYEDVSQGNSSFIMILLVVRNDVVQEYHNKALRIRVHDRKRNALQRAAHEHDQ